MKRSIPLTLAAAALLATAACASSTTFQSAWRNPDAAAPNFQGKKVAALVMSQDQAIRFGAEDALAGQLRGRGVEGVAAYTIVPRELLSDKEKARVYLEKANVKGVVALRVLGKTQEMNTNPGAYWSAPGYTSFYGAGYWAYGWGGVYSGDYIRTDTKVIVEILIYSLEQDKLVWAAQSETTNPSKVAPFIEELVVKTVAELKRQGLTQK